MDPFIVNDSLAGEGRGTLVTSSEESLGAKREEAADVPPDGLVPISDVEEGTALESVDSSSHLASLLYSLPTPSVLAQAAKHVARPCQP